MAKLSAYTDKRGKRHRGTYDPSSEMPYELSRSAIEKFIRCPACFHLERRRGVKSPSFPPFNLNSNTDRLLKMDFDKCRGKSPHPIMRTNGLSHLMPFSHPDLECWRNSLHFGLSSRYLNYQHEPTGLLVGGGIDDVWIDQKTEELYVVDYKSTSNQSNDPTRVTLDGRWKLSYKRQAEIYQWVLLNKGFAVSEKAYFVYVDGLHKGFDGMIDADPSMATMKFETTVLEYRGNNSWVEPLLFKIKSCLVRAITPDHDEDCEYGRYLKAVNTAARLGQMQNYLTQNTAQMS